MAKSNIKHKADSNPHTDTLYRTRNPSDVYSKSIFLCCVSFHKAQSADLSKGRPSHHIPVVFHPICFLSDTLPLSEKGIMVALTFTCTIYHHLFLIYSECLRTQWTPITGCCTWPCMPFPIDLKWTVHFCHTGRATLHLQMLMAHSQPLMHTSCISMSFYLYAFLFPLMW